MGKLLIVDDEADVREFAANFFRKRKIDVWTAESGEEALEVMDRFDPDLILLDIKMGGMDGIETLKFIKIKNKDSRVIMVTGTKPDEQNSFDCCRDLGALDYIHKPLQLDELEKTVLSRLTDK